MWTLVERDGEGGRVVVDDVGADRHVELAAAYGHGGKPPAGTSLVVARLADGGVAVATPSAPPPSGTVGGDGNAWVTDSEGNGVIADGNRVALIRAGRAAFMRRLARDKDVVNPTASMTAWINAVSEFVGIPGPGSFGVVVGSSGHNSTD